MDNNIKFPFGEVTVLALTATGAQALTIEDNFTEIDGVTVEASGNRTINLTLSSELQRGAMLLVRSKTAATQTTIPGTGMTGATVTGVAGKTINVLYYFNGTAFVQASAQIQID